MLSFCYLHRGKRLPYEYVVTGPSMSARLVKSIFTTVKQKYLSGSNLKSGSLQTSELLYQNQLNQLHL